MRPSLVVLLWLAPSLALAQHASRSIGAPNRGRLEDGVRIAETEHLVLQPASTAHFWGTAELVGLITRAAEGLHEQSPGPRVMVGALSRRRGGRLPPHRSHQNGRDLDVGYALTDEDGAPVEARRFVELGEGGCGRDRGVAYCLDASRTFWLFAALLADPEAGVQWILIAPDLREQVLAAGRRLDVSDDVRERVALATEPRAGSEHHRSHFHVRIYCPVDDRPRCVDTAPFHPWYEGEPPRPRRRRGRRPRRR
ncbi:MAG: penicillin-insensitive murein endopeptidase [Myxococcota bacterium]|nr:penicillin-insensitive murein endopeptidase [Myxococcota bacterium]